MVEMRYAFTSSLCVEYQNDVNQALSSEIASLVYAPSLCLQVRKRGLHTIKNNTTYPVALTHQHRRPKNLPKNIWAATETLQSRIQATSKHDSEWEADTILFSCWLGAKNPYHYC